MNATPRPTTYAIAVAQEFAKHGYRLETGWHVKTRAKCEPQKAMSDLRAAGIPIAAYPLRRGCWQYIVPVGWGRKCLSIARTK